jgi:hypothetical protein
MLALLLKIVQKEFKKTDEKSVGNTKRWSVGGEVSALRLIPASAQLNSTKVFPSA